MEEKFLWLTQLDKMENPMLNLVDAMKSIVSNMGVAIDGDIRPHVQGICRQHLRAVAHPLLMAVGQHDAEAGELHQQILRGLAVGPVPVACHLVDFLA